MKPRIFTVLILFLSLSLGLSAQVTKPNFVRIDPVRFLSALAFNLGYEYSISPTIGIGAEAMFNTKDRKWVGKDNVGVFGRFYFDSNTGISTEGIFCEVFTRASTWHVEKEDLNANPYSKSVTDLSIGFGGGYKYMLKNGLGIDFSGGLGRFLFAGEDKLDWKLQVGLGWAF